MFAQKRGELLCFYALRAHVASYYANIFRKRILTICSELAAKEITYRPPSLFPSSKETITTIKNWLEDCSTTHLECQQLQQNAKSPGKAASGPRRLLYLSGNASHPQLRLQENDPANKVPQYIALSYCWGGDQPFKLLNHLVQLWVKDMPYDQLPQTLKDAIQVTMSLGLNHLWIDALCIIQDSDQDKAEEISRMADIYEQAYVTISAARATAVSEGFLHSRYIAGEQGFRMPFTCGDGRPSTAILWQGREPDAEEPIDTRSWCLQESILSPRVLEYGTHNIRYHCARTRNDDSGPQFDGWIGHSKTFAQLNMSNSLNSGVDWASLDDHWNFVQVWQRLVLHYTRLSLGWYQDKLLAISAIARKMSRSANKTYIAGLWAEHLGECLLWYPNHDPDAQETPRRHATYVAPSWSWGSFSGEINFTFAASSQVPELVSYEVVTTVVNDEFSAVTAAKLEIRTLLLRARIRKGFYGWSLWDEQMQDKVDGDMRLDVAPDAVDGEVVEDEQVLLALVMSPDALLLKRARNTSSGDVYTRIGVYREGQPYMDRPQWEMGQVIII